MARLTKDQAARQLADAHYAVDPGVQEIYRLLAPQEREEDAAEPVKLLEVNLNSAALGIRPVFFGPDQETPFPSVVVDVAPVEFEEIRSGRLTLPNDWRMGDCYPRVAAQAGVE